MKQSADLKICIRYENQYGYIGYNTTNNSINVQLDHAGKRGEVEKYLSQEQVIPISKGNIGEFAHVTMLASHGIADFKAVLTYLWMRTGVSVDWSRPVE
ncbi:MAG: hypothetical protein LLG02_01340 [Pelosinus sp.]|nr:hypothetical protein [Pelosinus sp.]